MKCTKWSRLVSSASDTTDRRWHAQKRSGTNQVVRPRPHSLTVSFTRRETMEVLRAAGVHPLVSGFPEGAIVVFDGDLRYLSAGGHGLSLVGLTREMIEGKNIYEVFPYQVPSVLEPSYGRALCGEDVTIDIDFGGRTYMHRIGPLTDSAGVIVAGIGFALDVTQERQSRSALAASEERLRRERHQLREAEAVGHSGSWEWDTVTDVITWSDGLFVLHGLDPMTFDGGYAQAASRVHPDDRERSAQRSSRAAATRPSSSVTGSHGLATGRRVGSIREPAVSLRTASWCGSTARWPMSPVRIESRSSPSSARPTDRPRGRCQ